MIKLKKLVILQVIFAVASVSYLLISAWIEHKTGEPLSAAPMVPSLVLFALYGFGLYLAKLPKKLMYRIAMGLAILAFGGGGVVGNILRYMDSGLEHYASFTAYVTAVAINGYGTVLNIIAVLGLFTFNTKNPN